MRSQRNHRIAAAVAATLSALWGASVASAQYRIGQDGHANDASNRIGSGGINQGGSPSNQLVTGNQIVTGNVTGGREFRGNVPYTDPLAFRGVLAGRGIDNFIRDSSGVPAPNQPAFGLDIPRAFYGDARGTQVPVGTVREGFTGAYVGTSLSQNDPYASFNNAPSYQNLRPGNTSIVGNTANDTLLTSVSTLPGNTFGNPQALSASPLTGIRAVHNVSSPETYFADRYNNLRGGESSQNTFDDAAVEQMRKELNNPDASALTSGRISNDIGGSSLSNDPNDPTASGANGSPSGARTAGTTGLQKPGGLGQSNALPNQRVNNQLNSPTINASVDLTGQSLASPSRQSAQYSELQNRLDQFQQTHPLTPAEQANRLRLQKLKSGKKPAGAVGPGGGTTRPANVPGGATQPAVPGQPDAPASIQPGAKQDLATPLKVGSLATGIQAKGLHDLMAGAEDLMHHDKFASAIIKYNEAERVAPNNPLIPLGRAQAELGAGYYGKAESDLRRVFASDPAVLMGQYDLTTFLSQQRLDYLNKDLKDLANTETRSERPWFLLAYIAYNTGDNSNASKYLDEAEKRSSTKDPILQLMRTHWTLSKSSTPATAPTDLNK